MYGKFAEIYARGEYPRFSAAAAGLLPPVLRQFKMKPRTVLDVACGEGTFAVAMAKNGHPVTGVDQSREMLRLARMRARTEGVRVRFLRRDMRSLSFREEFDLATCWYDSLNYLLRQEDLERTFRGVRRALKEGGFFIFDMNNEHALSVVWQRNPSNVQQDDAETFEVHRPSWDPKRRIATLRITGFIRSGKMWTRIDEEHRERAYGLPKIRRCLRNAGLRELAVWGSIRDMTPVRPGNGRVWIVAQKS